MGARVVYFLFAICVIFAACNSPMMSEPEAEVFLSKYFEGVRAQQYDSVMTLYSPYFFNSMPQVQWRPLLENVSKQLGTLQSYKLDEWSIQMVKSKGSVQPQDGTYVTLKYTVQYAKYPARETFVVFKPIDSQSCAIFSHYIKSQGLQDASKENKAGI